MTLRLVPRKVLKSFTYGAAALFGGSAALYISYRPHDVPGPETLAATPPRRNDKGEIVPPKFPSIKSRAQQIADLRQNTHSPSTDSVYDLLIIGGGATGTGIALDAVTRGLKVALVERDDFGSGTSSKSTKLVHGGVRYLEKAVWNLDYSQYKLVKEALKERKSFLHTAPHLSSWLPIMLPLERWWHVPYFWAGTKFYDFLAGREGIESSYFLNRSKALEAFPMLRKENLFGALVYYDGQHNDSRMNVSLAMTAALYGATVVNHVEVTGLDKGEDGKICGARIRDQIPNLDGNNDENDFIVRAKGVINATGPFTDAIVQMDGPRKRDIVAPSCGVHVVLPGYLSPQNMGLIDPSTSDGRVIFFLPWEGNTIAGTTDSACKIMKDPIAGEDDINWILDEIRGYLTPDINIQRSDILAAWSGIRPLVRDPNSKNTESLVRNHLITVSPSGLLTCAGGKWTTYRQMAEDAVDAAIATFNLRPSSLLDPPNITGDLATTTTSNQSRPHTPALNGTCQTDRICLIGAHGYSKTLFINLIQHFNLSTDIAKHLAQSYGDRAWDVAALASPSPSSPSPAISSSPESTSSSFSPGHRLSPDYPFIDGEIRYACRSEYAQTATDFLARRTRLSFLNAQAALEALPAVIDVMAAELGWNQVRRQKEWSQTVEFLGSMGLPQSLMRVTMEQVIRRDYYQLDLEPSHHHPPRREHQEQRPNPSSSGSSSSGSGSSVVDGWKGKGKDTATKQSQIPSIPAELHDGHVVEQASASVS